MPSNSAPDNEKVKQWTLTNEASLQKTFAYLQSLFQPFVFPATPTMTIEAGLMKHSGGFEFPRLKTRCVILAAINQVGPLRQTAATLIEKFGSGPVAKGTGDHLALLRQKYPEAMRIIELPHNYHPTPPHHLRFPASTLSSAKPHSHLLQIQVMILPAEHSP